MSFFDIFPTFQEAPYSYVLTPVIFLCSIVGFYNKVFFYRNLLHPYEVWRGNRQYTLLTSAVIHRNWWHLMFNVIIIYGLGYDMFGNIEQVYGTNIACVITLILFVLFTVIPNLIQTIVKREDFAFTAVGASGLSSSLLGFSFVFFPLQKIDHLFMPFIKSAGHYWLYVLLIMILFSFIKNLKINIALHIAGYLIGSFVALLIRLESLDEIIDVFTMFRS